MPHKRCPATPEEHDANKRKLEGPQEINKDEYEEDVSKGLTCKQCGKFIGDASWTGTAWMMKCKKSNTNHYYHSECYELQGFGKYEKD